MRFLHTADWQIGMKAAALGDAGEEKNSGSNLQNSINQTRALDVVEK
jgi:DNA repair exonuclease SbcCD nuclease subunit